MSHSNPGQRASKGRLQVKLIGVAGASLALGFGSVALCQRAGVQAETIAKMLPVAAVPLTFAHKWACKHFGRDSMLALANTGFGLGLVAGEATVLPAHMGDLSLFLKTLAAHHVAEFVLTALYNTKTTNVDSYLVAQTEYCVAMVAAIVEYCIEAKYFPSLKNNKYAIGVGLAGVLMGELVRKGGMMWAQHNFTHLIQYSKRKEHELVTTGPYAIWRHPTYFGWFWRSVSTQILLGNPICFPAYWYVSQKFFQDRIPEEEAQLCSFFPGEYENYRYRASVAVHVQTSKRDL